MEEEEEAEALPKISGNYLIERQVIEIGLLEMYGDAAPGRSSLEYMMEGRPNLEVMQKIAQVHGMEQLKKVIAAGQGKIPYTPFNATTTATKTSSGWEIGGGVGGSTGPVRLPESAPTGTTITAKGA